MNKLLEKLPKKFKEKLIKKEIPIFIKPMLATLTNNYFSDKNWIYERKFDGVRCLLFKNKNISFLKSRNNHLISDTYPEILTALKKVPAQQVILDSELVTFDKKITSFEKLQPRIGVIKPSKALMKKVKVYVYIFDIVYLDGYDLTKLPLIKRKNILKHVLSFKDPLRYVIHKNTQGLPFFKVACKKGWEGLIAKNRESTYVHVRSKNWLKFKCIEEQEMVVGGYTDPQGSRIGFGSLLLGFYKDGKLMYAGKVGTGFNDHFLETFSARLEKIGTKKNPFSNKKEVARDEHFVKPIYVAEIGFEEWTKDNKLRQPRFLGIRDDKNAQDVLQEIPQDIIPNN
jgi:DNA ligase D-like protein (predicted ligase)